MDLFQKTQLMYLKYRHALSPILFVIGFLIDLKLVKFPDSIETIIFISIHFVITITLILFTSRAANLDMDKESKRKWNPSIKILFEILLQFSFGALASSLFVLYFKGSDYIASLPILILLATFLFGNEFAEKHTGRLEVRFISTILLIYAYLIFIIPLFRNEIGNVSLLISTIVSIAIAILLLLIIKKIAPVLFIHTKKVLISSILGLFVGLPLLIYFDIIPPLPLIMREGTVAHSIAKEYGTEYRLAIEPTPLYKRMGIPLLTPTYRVSNDRELVFFTSIYSPSDIKTEIIHVWKKYDPSVRGFVERSKIILNVTGGRKDGFRTYSILSDVEDGVWRVTAKLGTGQVLGHRDFRVMNGTPELVEAIK